MPVKTEKELNEQLRAYWLKAMAAIELRNYAYAISLLQAVLKQEPEFLTGRQLLRRAEVTRQKSGRKGFSPGARMAVMKAQREIKKNPRHAVEMIERVLEEQPYHWQANFVLREAAVAAGWLETAVFAVQTLLEANPRDTKLLHELGRLFQGLGDNERQVDVYNRISQINPTDAEAARLGKDASARGSMEAGGWGEAESYRDLIKDKEQAAALEQQNRMQPPSDVIEARIAEIYARHQAEPERAELARDLAVLSEQKNDLEAAIAWYRYALELTGGADAELHREISDLQVRQLEEEIATLDQFVSVQGAAAPGAEQKLASLAAAKKRRAELSIDEARRRVERNPTDLQFRLELGEHLMNAGRWREALPELQRARQNPNARLKAMNALGSCYRALGMYDLAAKQLEEAAGEILTMNATKKEIVYNLGLVYAEMKASEKSLACMKQIYEVDYGYRDVARRVESSYETPSSAGS